MSEEQKEHEAMKLVNAIDKLHKLVFLLFIVQTSKILFILFHYFTFREGLIQACKIGEDGKPQPIEHILQLQEELQKQQLK